MTRARSLLGTVAGGARVVLPEAPRLALRPDHTADWQASILLSRRPGMHDAQVDPLVIGGSLRLRGSMGAVTPDATGRAMLPAFLRGTIRLRDADGVMAQVELLGVDPVWTLSVTLSAPQARAVLQAARGVSGPLSMVVELDRPAPMHGPPVALSTLLHPPGAPAAGQLRCVVLNPDGTLWIMPPARRDIPADASRSRAEEAPAMLLPDRRMVSLPLALSSGIVAHPTAAAMIAGGAAGPAIAAGPMSHVYVVGDAVAAATDAPAEHLPLVNTAASAACWADALDATQGWFPPELTLISPAPSDDPAHAAFAFTIVRTGAVVGPGGAGIGLQGALRLTVQTGQSAATTAALATGGIRAAQPVPLQNLAASFELSYRQSGTSTILTQRFAGVATQAGNRITVEVDLLDDWVRLAYSALAYPSAPGVAPPRLVIDYAFRGYGRIRVPVFGGGGHHGLPEQVVGGPGPHPVVSPILLRDRLAVVGPTSVLQFAREAPGAARDFTPIRLTANALTAVRPGLVSQRPIATRLVTRSYVHEDAVPLSMPCSSLGAFYLQQSPGGAAVPIGCQDGLKLGETGLRAFEEIPSLQTARARVFRSLQQPGRFLLLPAAYRVGRYAPATGARAFKPMVMIYAVLDPDPSKNRYALSATLVPDVRPADRVRLMGQLAALTPARAVPEIVLPTDPFVAAQAAFTWVVPGDWAAPVSAAIVDDLVVTVSLPTDQALLMLGMVDNGGLLGAVRFTLPDGTVLNAALTVDGSIVGPADTGPVVATLAGGTATLVNQAHQAMHVTDVLTIGAGGALVTVAADTTLAPAATTTLAVGADATACFAEAAQTEIVPITELDIFVDDVTTDVTFINQVNFANHQLTALAVKARMTGDAHEQTVSLPEGGTASLSFTQKITTYLAAQMMEYALIETKPSGTTTGEWRPWDLNHSIVVGITADQI